MFIRFTTTRIENGWQGIATYGKLYNGTFVTIHSMLKDGVTQSKSIHIWDKWKHKIIKKIRTQNGFNIVG